MFRRLLPVALALAGVSPLLSRPAQGADPSVKQRFELSVDSIMRGPALVGYPPTGLRWSGDSKDLYFEWRKHGEDEAATWVVSRDGGQPRRLSDAERKLAPPASGAWDDARRRVLFVDDGDVVMVDSVARVRRQITRTSGNEANPRWAKGETHVAYTRENNLYLVPLEGGETLVQQLTDVQLAKRDPRLSESQRFLKEEEQKLIEFTREAAERKKRQEEKRKQGALPKLELERAAGAEGTRQSVPDAALSPDGVHVFLVVAERPEGSKTADVPNYVTESAYTENIQARTKVGDTQDKRRLAVLNLATGKVAFAEAKFAGSAQEPTELRPGDKPGDRKPAERAVRWSMPSFTKDGKYAVASVRAADNKDRWLVVVDAETGASRVLDHLHDDAWVREPGGFGGGSSSSGFLPDGRTFFFLSEKTGFMHLYSVDLANQGQAPRALTEGKWEVASAELSPDRKRFYITSTEAGAAERHLYSLPVEGGTRTRLTTRPGNHATEIAPDETILGDVFSYSNLPPDVYLMPLRPGADAQRVTTSTSDEWRSFAWVEPKLITFTARDGVQVPARLYTPEMVGAAKDSSRPGVVFVHGAGYLQNAHRYWSSYYREYMFHHLLAKKGYVVLDVDYRGSAGYGRDWRTAIYRYMGGKDLDDIVDSAKYLVEKQGCDRRRLGVYGGSYGGFITLMALFTSPDTFAAGAALRPVTDWAHYNHGYTSNILNEPYKDPEAYRKSSPIYFADKLKGALLIAHGMVDTNVHFQDSVRLAQRLIELRKENWELALYPVENHGFEEETSWADEYKRILKLFETNLKKRS
jgi:dipeptidyl aminopeptidase/acylaminoacyl peptidase